MTDGASTAGEYFGARAEQYDSLIRRAVPRYDEMIARLVDCLPAEADHVLELGCGTGTLTLALARRYPRARLVYVDASPEMVELTAARLRAADPGAPARAEGVRCRFEELPPGRGEFDLVASSISMHHVARKLSLFRAVHAHLRPGGAFRWADQLAGGTPGLHALIWNRWLEFCRLPGNCSEAEIQSLLEHAEAHDHYEPLAAHWSYLREAGFDHVDAVWRNLMWTVVAADRPAAAVPGSPEPPVRGPA